MRRRVIVIGATVRAESAGVREDKCSTCGEVLSAINSFGHERMPKAGDLSICFYCGQLYQFSIEPLSTTPLVRMPITDADYDPSDLAEGQIEALRIARLGVAVLQKRKAEA